jgi:hypothetical protein
MKRADQMIVHPSQLVSLSVFPGRRTPGRGRIVIRDERLEAGVRQAWEQRLNRLYFACGCDRAALGLGAGVMAALVWSVVTSHGWPQASWRGFGLGAGFAIAGGLVGKTVGLIGAERRLRATVHEIRSQWRPSKPATEGEIGTCG